MPEKIVKIDENVAEISGGRKVNIAMVPDSKPGDWVLVNADLAVSKVSEQEAREIKSYFN